MINTSIPVLQHPLNSSKLSLLGTIDNFSQKSYVCVFTVVT